MPTFHSVPSFDWSDFGGVGIDWGRRGVVGLSRILEVFEGVNFRGRGAFEFL